MTEARIKQNILRYLRSIPKSWWEVSGPGSIPGKPDITGCFKGQYVALEVKRPEKKATKLQAYTLQRLNDAGAITGVVSSIQMCKKIIEEGGDAYGQGD